MAGAFGIPTLAERVPSASTRARVHAWVRRVGLADGMAVSLAAALLVLFVRATYLPMVDIPQHTAQLAMWVHQGDPAFPDARFFAVNYYTPYLTAYALARVLAAVTGLLPAVALVAWASVALHYAAFAWLVRVLGHPRWVGLLGVPLGMGYTFYFGFISFVIAMPLVLVSIGLALRHRDVPSLRHGAALGAVTALTLASHGFAFGLAMLFVGPLLCRGPGGRGAGSLVRRFAPLATPVLLWAAWLLPATTVRTIGATLWEPRFDELLVSPALFFASSAVDKVALGFGFASLFLLATALGRPQREWERWAPLALLVLGFCLFPLALNGYGPLHPRFAACFVPALLLAFEPRPVRRGAELVAIAFAGAWFAVVAHRFVTWEDEVRPMARLIERLPRHLHMRPIVFERQSAAFPGLPALLHLSGYYQALKGGIQGYSFAMYPTSAVRYVPGFVWGMGGGDEWHPEWFSLSRDARELDAYDCFLVHSSQDLSTILFAGHTEDLELVDAEGDFRAYFVKGAHGGHSS